MAWFWIQEGGKTLLNLKCRIMYCSLFWDSRVRKKVKKVPKSDYIWKKSNLIINKNESGSIQQQPNRTTVKILAGAHSLAAFFVASYWWGMRNVHSLLEPHCDLNGAWLDISAWVQICRAHIIGQQLVVSKNCFWLTSLTTSKGQYWNQHYKGF